MPHASWEEVVRVESGCMKLRNVTMETGVRGVLSVVRFRQHKHVKLGRDPGSG